MSAFGRKLPIGNLFPFHLTNLSLIQISRISPKLVLKYGITTPALLASFDSRRAVAH